MIIEEMYYRMYEFAIDMNGIDVSIDRMEHDVEGKEVFAFVGTKIIFTYSTDEYQLRFNFRGRASKTVFFYLVKK
jgi:hypothetical protein